jgi:hypothetical protein
MLLYHFGGQPLTRYQFTAVLNKVLSISLKGIKSTNLVQATDIAMVSLPEEEICKAGR